MCVCVCVESVGREGGSDDGGEREKEGRRERGVHD